MKYAFYYKYIQPNIKEKNVYYIKLHFCNLSVKFAYYITKKKMQMPTNAIYDSVPHRYLLNKTDKFFRKRKPPAKLWSCVGCFYLPM